MVVKPTELPPRMQTRWQRLVPLLLQATELNVDRIARAWGCSRNSVMPNIKKMREEGLPIPKISERETVDDYGYCPDCGELLSVGMVDAEIATIYCPECAWDADIDKGDPVYTKFVTTAEAAKLLDVTSATILRWIKREELPAKRKGHTSRSGWRIPMYAIEARLDGRL